MVTSAKNKSIRNTGIRATIRPFRSFIYTVFLSTDQTKPGIHLQKCLHRPVMTYPMDRLCGGQTIQLHSCTMPTLKRPDPKQEIRIHPGDSWTFSIDSAIRQGTVFPERTSSSKPTIVWYTFDADRLASGWIPGSGVFFISGDGSSAVTTVWPASLNDREA